MKKILMSVVAMGMMTSSIYASCSDSLNDGGACFDHIDTLLALEGGAMYVGTKGDEKKLTGCKATSNVYGLILADAAGKKEMVASLLSALRADEKVTVRYRPRIKGDSTSRCIVTYVRSYKNN